MMKPTAADETPMWSHSFVTVGMTCRGRRTRQALDTCPKKPTLP